jgi:exodeoxyribonuclease V beta subunit
VADLLRRHLHADDDLAPYADLLETLDAPPLRGYLTGSLDAVLRRPARPTSSSTTRPTGSAAAT